MAVGSLSLASARGGADVRPILIAPAASPSRDGAPCAPCPSPASASAGVARRAVFDGLDDALA